MPEEEQEKIYKKVNADERDKYLFAGVDLMSLLQGDSDERDEIVFNNWYLPGGNDLLSKLESLTQYFKDNLQKTDDGFQISVIS